MKVTFYVPTLDSGATLERCIRSIKTQTNAKIKIIDGGSEDDTLEIAKSLGISTIIQQKKGLADARNLAVEDCRTELLAFIDSDCQLDRLWLRWCKKSLSDSAGVCGMMLEKNADDLPDSWRAFHLRQHWGWKSLEPDFLFGADSLYRTEALRKVNGFDQRYKTNFEDVDVGARLRAAGYRLSYEPRARCTHLRKDTARSVLRTARLWSFHSYPAPDSFNRLMLRLFVFNPHLMLNFVLKDIVAFRLDLIPLTIASFIYNEAYDLKHYFGRTS